MNEDTDYSKWTVLREGDGGRHVHELQVALVQKGFWPGEDDMLWWQFGDATCSAVQTFQVGCFFLFSSCCIKDAMISAPAAAQHILHGGSYVTVI